MIRYKTFRIKEIFQVFTGALVDTALLNKGEIPRVTATNENNGIAMFTADNEDKNFRCYENFISVSFLGSVFYQRNKVSLDMKIHGLSILNYDMTENIAMYLIPLIKCFTPKYSYGYQLSTSLLKEQKINLPINSNNEPDWVYMDRYVHSIKKTPQITAIKFLEEELLKIGEYKECSYSDVEWAEFRIKNIFTTLQRGKRLIKENQVDGNVPYISSTALNNGIDGFIDPFLSADNRTFENGITIANSGSVGKAFYQGYEFVGSDHITTLWNKHLNKYSALFVVTCLEQIGEKYSFNREMNNYRLSNDIIHLPVDGYGEINYIFMENYMKKILSKKIQKTIYFLLGISNS